MDWAYPFVGATSEFGLQPSVVDRGKFPLLAGIDGRSNGVLRRYPGHVRYPDTNNALHDADDITLDIDRVRPFTIQKTAGSNDTVRGFLAADSSTGELEIWYRFNDDAAGTIRRQELHPATGDTLVRATATEGSGEVVPGGNFGLAGGATASILGMVEHDDGTTGGSALYICGSFTQVGGRYCTGVARRLPSGRWEPVGLPAFEGGYGQCLAVHDGVLYMGGSFTSYDGAACLRLAKWDGVSWTQCEDGVDNGIVLALVSDGTDLHIGGSFTAVSGVASYCYATYDGSAYTAMTGTAGLDAAIRALCYGDPGIGSDVVCAAGSFTEDKDGVPNALQNHTAYITGGAWQDLGAAGSPPDETLCTSVVIYDSKLAVGWYKAADKCGVQTWDGAASTWASLGADATNNTKIHVLLTSGTTLFAGGAVSGSWTDLSDPTCLLAYSSGSWVGLTDNDSYGENDVNYSYVIQALASVSADSKCYAGGTARWTVASHEVVALDGYWDITAFGPYIYLLQSDGNHKVIYWDEDSSAFVVVAFGSGPTWLAAPTVSVNASGNHLAEAGYYQGAYRLVDHDRQRYSALSVVSPGAVATDQDLFKLEDASPNWSFPTEFGHIQTFRTVSSGDATVQAGGTLYRVVEGIAVDDWVHWHLDSSPGLWDDGRMDSGITDAMLPVDPTRAWDPIKEEVTELRSVYAVDFYQGCTVALEARGPVMDVRWSPTWRIEPENFPSSNLFPTAIPIEAAATCRFVKAGDYLYLFGGNHIYRIQKLGQALAVVEIYDDIPLLHADAVVRAGNDIYAATESGIILLRGGNGDLVPLPGLSRIFLDRWGATISTGSSTNTVRLAYDARMKCVYIHHHGLHETLCLWLSTGKLSMLLHNSPSCIVTAENIDTGGADIAYFITNTRALSTPNWNMDADTPQVMGATLYSGQTSTRWNAAITGYSDGTLTFDGYPFTSDGTDTDSNRVFFVPCFITFLTGNQAGNSYLCDTQGTNTLTIASSYGTLAPAPESGDIVAIAPVTLQAVGSPVWGSTSYASPLYTKVVTGATVMVQRLSSPGTHGQLGVPDASLGQLTFGALRHAALIADESLESTPVSYLDFLDSAEVRPGSALSTDQPALNAAAITAEGCVLYPVLQSLLSNLALELHFWEVSGEIKGTKYDGAS